MIRDKIESKNKAKQVLLLSKLASQIEVIDL